MDDASVSSHYASVLSVRERQLGPKWTETAMEVMVCTVLQLYIILLQNLLCNVGENWWLVIKQVVHKVQRFSVRLPQIMYIHVHTLM